jgi:hypothetical protein
MIGVGGSPRDDEGGLVCGPGTWKQLRGADRPGADDCCRASGVWRDCVNFGSGSTSPLLPLVLCAKDPFTGWQSSEPLFRLLHL